MRDPRLAQGTHPSDVDSRDICHRDPHRTEPRFDLIDPIFKRSHTPDNGARFADQKLVFWDDSQW
ncbi:MAG: hypothetical protein WAO08_35015, partial [Hyphomicrobiaceae bacterium]